jgi:aspartyl-tRNA synthetase
LLRTHTCGALRKQDAGAEVTLAGWVNRRRDHGGLIFIDLRDRDGVVQTVFNPEVSAASLKIAEEMRSEYVVRLTGRVALRPAGTENPKLPTGEVEVLVSDVEILNTSNTPPFYINEDIEVDENLRLKYRYLDLRRTRLKNNLALRHRVTRFMHDFLDARGFIEVETPIFVKSTPEGARDYLVPSRVNPGMFYALPQSPQLFKQLLMMSGFDRYMQIVRCFRDEDLRADRQPEFTQLDLEMSFVQPDDVIAVIEGCLKHVMKVIHGLDISTPFPRFSYAQAMSEYGIDRPDTRYDLRIKDISAIAGRTEFGVFRGALDRGGVVRTIRVPGGADMTRKETDTLGEDLKGIGAGGLPLVRIAAGSDGKPVLQGGASKFFTPERTAELLTATEGQPGDILFFAADTEANVCKFLSWLRPVLAGRRGLIPQGKWNFLWVLDFPMFMYDEESKRYFAVHHPFTAPRDEDVPLLETDPFKCRAKAYDVVLNGVELGGGSIRIHRAEVQQQVFRLLQMTPDEQRLKFGFLLEALKYGPPPHGGIALGLDRVAMLLTGGDNIREVIAFPKTARAACLLTEAPGPVALEQLDELSLRLAPGVDRHE